MPAAPRQEPQHLARFMPVPGYPEGHLKSVYKRKTGFREIKSEEGKARARGCRESVTGRDALG